MMSMLSVVGEELAHLVVEVIGVARQVPGVVLEVGVVAHGVDAVAEDGVIGVVPVEQGVVEADFETLGAEGFDVFLDQVAPGGCLGGFVVGVLRVEEAEAVVVLGGHDGVLHAGGFGGASPGTRVVVDGIESVEVGLVGGVR